MLRKSFTPLLLALIAISSIWYLSQQKETGTSGSIRESRSADSFMENFTTRVLNSSGRMESELQAEKMMHYPHDNHSEFLAPHLTLHQEDGERWSLVSESGLAENGTEKITLNGEVVMLQHPVAQDTPAIRLDTRDVLILTAASYAQTDQHALITQGKNRIESVGVNAWLEEKRILLLSQVRGLYEKQP